MYIYSLFFRDSNNIIYMEFTIVIREVEKKVLFLVARPLRPLAPHPLGLVAIGTFFHTLKKVLFSLVAHPFSPHPPLSVPATKKIIFFTASLINRYYLLQDSDHDHHDHTHHNEENNIYNVLQD